MKIGSQAHRTSAISSSNEDTILVRGRDLCSELIGRVSFTDHIWLLVTGQMPNDVQRRVLDATLVAIAEHGLVPSVQASRMTLRSSDEAVRGRPEEYEGDDGGGLRVVEALMAAGSRK